MENTDFDKRAKEHWEYVKEVLITHGESEDIVEKIKFHFVSAMKHGYKHGLEDRGTYKWKAVPKRRARPKSVKNELPNVQEMLKKKQEGILRQTSMSGV